MNSPMFSPFFLFPGEAYICKFARETEALLQMSNYLETEYELKQQKNAQ